MALKKYHVSANLLNYQSFQDNTNLDTYTGLPTTGQTTYKRIATIVPIDVSECTTVTLTYNSNYTDVNFLYSLFRDERMIERTANKVSGDTIDVSNADQLYVCFYKYMEDLTINDFSDVMLNSGSTALPYVPYGGTWNDIPYRRYETATDAVTNLPVEIFTDGQPVTSWTMKGNTTTSGTPSPSNPITISGVGNETANLLPPPTTAASGEINGITYNIGADGVCTFSGIATSTVSITVDLSSSFVIPISVSYGGNGTLALNNNKVVNASVRFYNGTTYVDEWGFSVINRTNTGYLTIGGKTINKYIIQFANGANAEGFSFAVAFSDNGVPVSPFEPYGLYKISILKDLQALTPIYLSQPLRKSLDGTAFDTLDSTGLVTYNVDEYGQPQTATTETVTVPTITTTGGTITLDVDTTIKPSEIDLTYHGWHEHQPLKRENGAWT